MPGIAILSLPFMLALSLTLADDQSLGQQVQPRENDSMVSVSVRGSDSLPQGCAQNEILEFLESFLDAYNSGNTTDLTNFFPSVVAYPHSDQKGFQWYSVTDAAGHFVAYSRADLLSYFRGRQQQHEELHLLELEVAASWHPGVDLVFRLGRHADDLEPHEMMGKGSMYCDEHSIFVWSMAQVESD